MLFRDIMDLGGLWFGLGAKDTSKFGRSGVVLFGMTLHIVAYFLCFLNLPLIAPIEDTFDVGYIEPRLNIFNFNG